MWTKAESLFLPSIQRPRNRTGFLSNSRSLLAWEVPLKNATFGSLAERWPNLAEAALKKQQASDVLDKCELFK